MKTLHPLIAGLAACFSWLYALIDWLAQEITVSHRPRLIPGRVFAAVYQSTLSYLQGMPFQLDTHGLRRADFRSTDPWTGKSV